MRAGDSNRNSQMLRTKGELFFTKGDLDRAKADARKTGHAYVDGVPLTEGDVDRIETLFEMIQRPRLGEVRFYLAGWGYNTPEQRKQARRHPRITVWTPERFLRP